MPRGMRAPAPKGAARGSEQSGKSADVASARKGVKSTNTRSRTVAGVMPATPATKEENLDVLEISADTVRTGDRRRSAMSSSR